MVRDRIFVSPKDFVGKQIIRFVVFFLCFYITVGHIRCLAGSVSSNLAAILSQKCPKLGTLTRLRLDYWTQVPAFGRLSSLDTRKSILYTLVDHSFCSKTIFSTHDIKCKLASTVLASTRTFSCTIKTAS